MKRLVILLLFIFIAALGLLLALLNPYDVSFNYYLGELELPQAVLLVLTLILGALLGMVSNLAMLLGRRRELAKLRKRVKLQEQEIRNLREIPLRDLH